MAIHQRTSLPDLLKGMAVLLMIQVHIVEKFATERIFLSEHGKLHLFLGGPPVAPVFMVVMGYFIAASKKTTQQLIIRGVQLFATGMLLNLALNANLFLSISRGRFQLDPLPYLFGVDILHFAGLATIVLAIFKKINQRFILVPLFMMAFVVLAGQWLMLYVTVPPTLSYFAAYFYGATVWSYFPLFPWLAYPLAGTVFYLLQQRFPMILEWVKKNHYPVIGVLGLIIAYGWMDAMNVSSNLMLYYHHDLIFFGWVIGFIVVYALLWQWLEAKAGNTLVLRALAWMGKQVTTIYIVQWIIIGNLSTEIYRSIDNPVILLFSFLGVLSFACMIAFLWEKIREKHQQLT
jgi:uncharacterized membrane protein